MNMNLSEGLKLAVQFGVYFGLAGIKDDVIQAAAQGTGIFEEGEYELARNIFG